MTAKRGRTPFSLLRVAAAALREKGVRPLFLLLCLVAAAPAAAGDVFDHPADAAKFARDLKAATTTLRGAQVLRGRYEQQKALAGVPRPLRAEGTFLFVRSRGIAWLTTRPFESELVITPTDIVQREGGKVSLHLSAAQQPSVRMVADIFTAVFALDFDALAARFSLFSRKVPGGWELGLRPRPGQGGALKQVVVSGHTQVERVRVSDTNGDETGIRLQQVVVSAAPPSPAELQRFSP